MTVIAATSGDNGQVVLGIDPEVDGGLVGSHVGRHRFVLKWLKDDGAINCDDMRQKRKLSTKERSGCQIFI